MNFQYAERILGYSFENKRLLMNVFCNSVAKTKLDNTNVKQELSFTGDAILYSLTSIYLMDNFLGDIADIVALRAIIVGNKHLEHIFHKYKFSEVYDIFLPSQKLGHTSKTYGNYVEGMLGAIYFDGGFDPTMVFAKKTIFKELYFLRSPEYRERMEYFIYKFSKPKDKSEIILK